MLAVLASLASLTFAQDDGALERLQHLERSAMAEVAQKAAEVFDQLEAKFGKEKTLDLFADSLKRAHSERTEKMVERLARATDAEAAEFFGNLKLALKEVGTPTALRVIRNAERSSVESRERAVSVLTTLKEVNFKQSYSQMVAQYDGSIGNLMRAQARELTRHPDILIPGVCLRGWFVDVVDENLSGRGDNGRRHGTVFSFAVASFFVVPFAVLGDVAFLIFQGPYWFGVAVYGVGLAVYSVVTFPVSLFVTTPAEKTISDLREEVARKTRELEELRQQMNSSESGNVGQVRR